jgi:hypothetical protein
MHSFLANRRWAVVTFGTICGGVVILLFAVTMVEGYYMEHAVVIPLWARALMVTGALVKLYSVRIVLGSAVVLAGVAAASSRLARQ